MSTTPFFNLKNIFMNVYEYVASSNPSLAQEIINHFGYEVKNTRNMGDNLKKLVSNEGEPALRLILNNHPDKDIILELFKNKEEVPKLDCTKCEDKILSQRLLSERFLNANGVEEQSNSTNAKTVENNFSVVFLAGIVVLAFAIMSNKK